MKIKLFPSSLSALSFNTVDKATLSVFQIDASQTSKIWIEIKNISKEFWIKICDSSKLKYQYRYNTNTLPTSIIWKTHFEIQPSHISNLNIFIEQEEQVVFGVWAYGVRSTTAIILIIIFICIVIFDFCI